MDLSVSYDPESDSWTIVHRDVRLLTEQDVTRWRQLVFTQLTAATGRRKVDFSIDLHEFEIAPAVADSYGKVAREIRTNFARSIVRYGPEGIFTASMIRVQSIKNAYPSMIFTNRGEALETLRILREQRKVG